MIMHTKFRIYLFKPLIIKTIYEAKNTQNITISFYYASDRKTRKLNEITHDNTHIIITILDQARVSKERHRSIQDILEQRICSSFCALIVF